MFVQGNVASYGSLTYVSDSSGVATVFLDSNTSQKDTVITVSSQGGTKTVKVTFNAALKGSGKTLTASAPTSIKSGHTLFMTAVLKDKFGNPVKTDNTVGLSVVYDGPGLIVGTLPATTDADGKVTVRVLVGAADTGVATLTVTHDPAGLTFAAATTLTASASTWVGPIANATASASKGRVVIETYAAKGKTVRVYVGSKLRATFVADKMNDKFVLKGVKSGARNVEVRLAGSGDFFGALSVK